MTDVDLDDDVLAEAARLLGTKTKKDVGQEAVRCLDG
ncbi:type II toxin-antitoxin system VapB family antitoxin [Streptomyces sp. CC210A]|nr:type II toxin-antitoxin system VapB family antitoxin [Streptomyces sp. CC210A]